MAGFGSCYIGLFHKPARPRSKRSGMPQGNSWRNVSSQKPTIRTSVWNSQAIHTPCSLIIRNYSVICGVLCNVILKRIPFSITARFKKLIRQLYYIVVLIANVMVMQFCAKFVPVLLLDVRGDFLRVFCVNFDTKLCRNVVENLQQVVLGGAREGTVAENHSKLSMLFA